MGVTLISETQPRRAAGPKRRTWLWMLVAVLAAVVVALVSFGAGGAGIKTVERAVPVPGPTWTQPIPQTPAVCVEAMGAADRMFYAGIAADDAATAAANRLAGARTVGQVNEARKLNEKAKRAAKAASQARRTYLDISAKCKESV